MNTDFVPLSSLLESMKAPSFEGLDKDVARSESIEKPVSDPQPKTTDTPPLPQQNEVKESPTPPEKVAEKVCSEPKILLDRDGDKISRIRVLCSCGQSIVLDCQYPN